MRKAWREFRNRIRCARQWQEGLLSACYLRAAAPCNRDGSTGWRWLLGCRSLGRINTPVTTVADMSFRRNR